MQPKIQLSELIVAVERAVVRSYDDEQSEYVTMKRFGWAAMALGFLALALTVAGVVPYNRGVGVFAAFAGIAWLVSRAEWEATRRQIVVLEKALADQKMYIGGRNREVYLTTDPHDTVLSDSIGVWLRSPLRKSSNTSRSEKL